MTVWKGEVHKQEPDGVLEPREEVGEMPTEDSITATACALL